jgi:hypothetical protein
VDQQSRQKRLAADRDALAALAAESTIFSYEEIGELSDRYTLTLRGKGLARQASAQTDAVIIELHQIDLRLPFAYPDSPPDVRWLTPIWHPAVSFSGFVNLADVGLSWTPDMSIDMVCERLWAVARLAPLPLSKAANYSAKNWLEKECTFELPVDPRSLRDRAVIASGSNIVRYERRTGKTHFAAPKATTEVLFIDEHTPTPPLPERQPYIPISRRRTSDDVFYIGPE